MKYYKIVDPKGHRGIIYHEGINVDPLPFNPSGDCKPGGIYFAKEDILAFVNYGTELYEVEPIGEIYENPGMPKKYKAHELNLKYVGKVIDNIERWIRDGADVHANYDFALRWAAKNGDYKVVKLLIKHGANVHANDNSSLRLAAGNGHYKIVKLLLKHGANVHADNDAALRWAVENEHYKIVKLLLKAGANVHANDNDALCSAAIHGYYNIIKLLLKYGADVHTENDFALRCAKRNNDKKMIKLLESYIN